MRIGQPIAEDAVAHMRRHPGDVLVELHHTVAELGHRDVPGRHRLVDQRLVGAPAMRIVVVVGLVAEDDAGFLEVADDRLVGLEHVEARIGRRLAGEIAGKIHRVDHRQPFLLADIEVVLAEGRRDVDDTGALSHLDEVAGNDAEAALVLLASEEGEERRIGAPDKLGALHRADIAIAFQLRRIGLQRAFRQDQPFAILLHHRVIGVGRHRQAGIGRQRPRGRRPGKQPRLGVAIEQEADGQRRVLAGAIGIVEPRLRLRQRRLRCPGIGHDAIALIDQPLLPQLFEGPDGALHVGEVHGAVVVLEIDPARRTVDVIFPVAAELHDRRAAVLVELRQPVFENVLPTVEVQLLLRMQLRRQAVAVPAESAFDHIAAHGPVARHHVLHESGDDVPVVRQAIGKGRAVIEDEFRRPLLTPALDRRLEGLLGLPGSADGFLDMGKAGRRVGGRIDSLGGCRHGFVVHGIV